MSHAAGVGAPFPREVVRAMLLLRANTLALGHSGCRPLLVDRLLDVPRAAASIRSCRSRGASAHRAIWRRSPTSRCRSIGRGQVELGGQRRAGAASRCARRASSRSTLEAKEGLALLNGTQMMSAIGALLLADADRLARTASVAAAMSVEALLGTDVAFAAAYQLARPHPGQIAVAAELRHLLRDSALQAGHHGHDHKVQDPYSLRCVPQVHGAVRDALDHLRRVLDIELNSRDRQPARLPRAAASPTRARSRPAAAG